MLALDGVDGQRAQYSLGDRDGNVAVAVPYLDVAVGFCKDDRLHPFFIQTRQPVLDTFRSATRVARLALLEAGCRQGFGVADLIARTDSQ